jgi:hypothetical protein
MMMMMEKLKNIHRKENHNMRDDCGGEQKRTL